MKVRDYSLLIHLLLLIVLLVSSSSGFALTPKKESRTFRSDIDAFQAHTNIEIDGNQELIALATTEGWSGNGSATDPYVISGYSFSDVGRKLRISNIDLHLRIEGNQFMGAITNDAESHHGVFIDDSSNVTLVDNHCVNIYMECFGVSESANIKVSKNVVNMTYDMQYQEYEQIMVIDSTDILFEYNDFSESIGMVLVIGSNHTVFRHNLIKSTGEGFNIQGSTYLHLINNSFVDSSIIMFQSSTSLQTFNFEANTVNGKQLLLYHSIADLTITEDFGQLILVNTTRVSVSGFSLQGGTAGIWVQDSTFVDILNGKIYDQYLFGIWMENTNHSTIRDVEIIYPPETQSSPIYIYINAVVLSRAQNITCDYIMIENAGIGFDTYQVRESRFVENTVVNADTGILLEDGVGNTVIKNLFENVDRPILGEEELNTFEDNYVVDGDRTITFDGNSTSQSEDVSWIYIPVVTIFMLFVYLLRRRIRTA